MPAKPAMTLAPASASTPATMACPAATPANLPICRYMAMFMMPPARFRAPDPPTPTAAVAATAPTPALNIVGWLSANLMILSIRSVRPSMNRAKCGNAFSPTRTSKLSIDAWNAFLDPAKPFMAFSKLSSTPLARPTAFSSRIMFSNCSKSAAVRLRVWLRYDPVSAACRMPP